MLRSYITTPLKDQERISNRLYSLIYQSTKLAVCKTNSSFIIR